MSRSGSARARSPPESCWSCWGRRSSALAAHEVERRVAAGEDPARVRLPPALDHRRPEAARIERGRGAADGIHALEARRLAEEAAFHAPAENEMRRREAVVRAAILVLHRRAA